MEKKPVTMKKLEFPMNFFTKNRNFTNLSRYFTIKNDNNYCNVVLNLSMKSHQFLKNKKHFKLLRQI